jgi:peptidyl-tRNA hydrolase
LKPGLQVAQVAHAVGDFFVAYRQEAESWDKDSKYVVVLAVADEKALSDLIVELEKDGIAHVVVDEPDLANELTAVATVLSPEQRSRFSSLPLALRQTASTLVGRV